MRMSDLIKTLLAVFVIAAGVSAQQIWDGTFDTTWYTSEKTAASYTITTAAQLAGLVQLVNGSANNGTYNMEGKTITLGANIFLNDTTGWKNWATSAPARTWTPIGIYNNNGFNGTFDGDGYFVSGIYINNSSDNQGLFGYVGGGYGNPEEDEYAAIRNLGVVASYVKGNQYVGGLVGLNKGSIANCYATGNVAGNQYIGGLVGYHMIDYTDITNCYAAGNVTGTQFVGGLVGYYVENNPYVIGCRNSYYDSQTSGQSDNGEDEGAGLTTSEMKDMSFVDKLNFGAIANNLNGWVYRADNYPVLSNEPPSGTVSDYFANGDGTENNPYIIQTSKHLENFSAFVDAGKYFAWEYIKLGANIMLNDTTDWQNWATTPPINVWTPISAFAGTFDGNNYVIGGVYVNNTKKFQSAGLFGLIEDYDKDYDEVFGTVKNLGVVASYVKGYERVGIIAGCNEGTITNCYTIGNVEGNESVGGLVGYGGDITNCYATGSVSGDKYVGGLVGSTWGYIINCYATGNVTGTQFVGGLAGESWGDDYFDSSIVNSYATGNVMGNESVGGLVGVNDGATITDSYYDSQTSGRNDTGKGEPKTTAQMKQQGTYVNWDFTDIWAINAKINYGYPYLRIDITGIIIDDNFRNAIYEIIGKEYPEPIYNADVDAITVLDLPNKGIESLRGIEYFVSLISLNIGNGQQKRDDVSTPNRITVLDLLKNTQLQEVDVSGNELTELNVSSLTDLIRLYASGNKLTGLDVSNNTKLEELELDGNRIGSLSDIIGLLNTKIREEEFELGEQITPVISRQSVKKFGILLKKAVVSESVNIKIITPERAQINIIIYDNLGNVVFEANDRTDSFVWDLRNKTGKNVANGSYLIIAEAKGVSGKVYRYSAKVGVKSRG